MYFENVTINEKGLKSLIITCKKMKSLKELYLINMPDVKNNMKLIEKSFSHHKSLEILNLAKNKLPDYDAIVAIL